MVKHGIDLAWTTGDWQGIRTDPKTGTTYPITIRVRPILASAGTTEEMEVYHGANVYRAFAITAFDSKRQQWVMQYVNNVDGRSVPMQGEFDGETITWRAIDPDRTRESKLVFERRGHDECCRTQFASGDGGSSWFVIFTDDLHKVAHMNAETAKGSSTIPK